MENNVEVKKEGKGKNIVIVLLILIIIGLISFIVYDKFIKNETNKDTTPCEKTVKTDNEIKDITSSEVAKTLEKNLISKDNYNSLYLSKNVSISDVNNIDLITFNLKKYKEDNNLEYSKNVDYKDLGNLNLTVSKIDFNKYMNEKYNVEYNYNLNNIDENSMKSSSSLGVCVTLFVDENNYKFVSVGASCTNNYVKNKLIKAEEDNEYVYLYDTAVTCTSEAGAWCNKTSDDSSLNTAVLDCIQNTTNCPVEVSSEKMAEYVINNMSDKLNKFKHTFKKENGNYYWVSSEITE